MSFVKTCCGDQTYPFCNIISIILFANNLNAYHAFKLNASNKLYFYSCVNATIISRVSNASQNNFDANNRSMQYIRSVRWNESSLTPLEIPLHMTLKTMHAFAESVIAATWNLWIILLTSRLLTNANLTQLYKTTPSTFFLNITHRVDTARTTWRCHHWTISRKGFLLYVHIAATTPSSISTWNRLRAMHTP